MIVILTGPIRTGKSTALRQTFTAPHAPKALGVLQPVIDGRRHLLDLATGTTRHLEAQPGEAIVRVGRFAFAAESFAWARTRLNDALRVARPETWLVVDEVGPLELRGAGLAPALGDVIAAGRSAEGPRVLLVIREPLLTEAVAALGVGDATVLRAGQTLPDGVRIAGA